MKKVCIVGHFGFGENLLNGQTVKTKNITYELEKLCGKDNVIKIDTHGGMKKLFNIILKIFKAFKYSENIIIGAGAAGLFCAAQLAKGMCTIV